MPQPTTEELLAAQSRRERVEQERAETTSEPEEVQAHERRAAKAAYLRQRLKARADADQEAPGVLRAPDG